MEGKSCPSTGNTIIGNDVWIGHNAVIMPGIQISDGAIVGSFSVVTKNVTPYLIVGGHPARELRMRFEDADIKTLLEIHWWYWPADKLSRNVHLLTGTDISKIKNAV